MAIAKNCNRNLEAKTKSCLLDWYVASRTRLNFIKMFKNAGFFFLGDALNTTITVINNLQNEVQAYNTILLCELLMVATAAQTVGIYGFMQVQRAWDLSTKTMLNITAICLIMLDVYGMVGAWTNVVGFHHRWEFWLYNVWWGVTLCPWYSYSQTMVRIFYVPFLEIKKKVLEKIAFTLISIFRWFMSSF